MATSLTEVAHFLDLEGLRYARAEHHILMGWNTDRYQDHSGTKHLTVVIQVPEDGEYVKVFVPQAFRGVNTNRHQGAFFKACMMAQWHTKMIQFEYDDSDGEVRPIIEFPLEDARLTRLQLARCVHAIVHLIDDFYPVLQRALTDGVIEMPQHHGASLRRSLSELLGGLPDELVADALRDADQRRRTSPGV
jgi:hypothetical protein